MSRPTPAEAAIKFFLTFMFFAYVGKLLVDVAVWRGWLK